MVDPAQALAKAYGPGTKLAEASRLVATELHEVCERGGTVFVTGIGKSGYVGRRIAASLASIGVKAQV